MYQPHLPGYEANGPTIFCRSFWHARARRRIYAPPGKVFAFRVRKKRAGK